MARKTALVLSGGGSLGAVQVGMLQALVRTGLSVDMVIGASVGALNGAFFARYPTADGVAELAALWRSLRRRDIFPLSILTGLKALLLRRDHLIEADGVRALVHRALDIHRVEETRLPLHIIATDALNGDEAVLSTGDIEAALAASTAIPLVFPHVEIAGRYLVDGGVGSNTPIAAAVALGAERIIVLPTGMSCAAQRPPGSLVALALHTLTLMHMRQVDRAVAHYANQAEITIVPPLCPLESSALDFSRVPELIARAEKDTTAWLAADGLARTGPLPKPLAHHHSD